MRDLCSKMDVVVGPHYEPQSPGLLATHLIVCVVNYSPSDQYYYAILCPVFSLC